MLIPNTPEQVATLNEIAKRLRKAGWIAGRDAVRDDDDLFLQFTTTGKSNVEALGRAELPLRNYRMGSGLRPTLKQRLAARLAKCKIQFDLAMAGAIPPIFTVREWELFKDMACSYTVRWTDERN